MKDINMDDLSRLRWIEEAAEKLVRKIRADHPGEDLRVPEVIELAKAVETMPD